MQNFISVLDSRLDAAKEAIRNALEPIRPFLDPFSNAWLGLAVIAVVFLGLLVYNLIFHRKMFRVYLKNARVLSVCSLMIALNVILGYFSIQFGLYLRVGFGFITLPVVTALFGPLVGCVTGILQDVLSFVLKPTGAYLIGLTLNVGISGMLYGMMLYGKPITLWRIFCTKVLIVVVVNILLNTIALAPTVGIGMIGILPARILKNLVLIPIQTIVVYVVLDFVKNIKTVKVSE